MNKTKQYILWALFAALTAVASQISIPLPFTPIPINLATLSVYLAGGLLGAKGGAVSQTVYIFLGIIGLPVFANFHSSLGYLIGPTGGYAIGYIFAAWAIGLLTHIPESKNKSPNGASAEKSKSYRTPLYKGAVWNAAAMLIGMIICYSLGTAWFIYTTGAGYIAAMGMCVIPFLPGDALKIALASVLVGRLRKAI